MSTISGTISNGIRLGLGGYTSPLTITVGGTVSNTHGDAISSVFPEPTIINYGLIRASGYYNFGIVLNEGGVVQNSGTILGDIGIGTDPFSGDDSNVTVTVVNSGTVNSIYLRAADWTITNTGLIRGISIEPGIQPNGSYINTGYSTGVVTNSGTAFGIFLDARATIVNSGTIIGTGVGAVAISFGSEDNNLLALENGYHIIGTVIGNFVGSDTLELRGTAGNAITVDYNGLHLFNFDEVLFSGGGYATLLVSNTGTLGITIAGFDQPSEAIDLTGIGTDGTIAYLDAASDRITVAGSLGSVTLQFDSIDSVMFATGGDGGSGTDLSIAFASTEGDDTVQLTPPYVAWASLGGNDTVFGTNEPDSIYGGDGNDWLDGGIGNDLLVGESGDDVLIGGDGDDLLYAGGGLNYLYGYGGNDILVGGPDFNILQGGVGNDYLYLYYAGGLGYGDDGNDVLIGNLVTDVLIGGNGDDTFYGYGGNDYFYGQSGNDIMFGGDGVDVLIGGDGDDYFDGGPGVNYYFGGDGGGPGTGLGNNTFNVTFDEIDVVQDWTEGRDRILLNGSGFQSFSDVLAHSYQNGSYLVVQLNANSAVWINGANASSINVADVGIVS